MEHAAHWESPGVGAMEPAEQEVQVLMTVAPEAAENLPAEHRSPSQIANSVEDKSGNFTEFLSRPAFWAILKFV